MVIEDGEVREGFQNVAMKERVMLRAEPLYTLPTEEDRRVFQLLVPPSHYLRRAAQTIDFERFRPLMAPCYSPDQGRPALEPVVLLKLEFLQYHDRRPLTFSAVAWGRWGRLRFELYRTRSGPFPGREDGRSTVGRRKRR